MQVFGVILKRASFYVVNQPKPPLRNLRPRGARGLSQASFLLQLLGALRGWTICLREHMCDPFGASVSIESAHSRSNDLS